MTAGLDATEQAMNDQKATTLETPPDRAYGSFVSGVALTLATRLLMLVGVVGSGVIVARWLGPEGFGQFAVLNATVAIAMQIGSAGLPSANTYFIAMNRKSIGPLWANAIVFAAAGGTLLVLAIIVLAKLRPEVFAGLSLRLVAIAALSIPFQLLILLGLNVLLAMDRIGQMNFIDSLAPALALLNAILALVVLRAELATLVSFNTAAVIVISGTMVWAIARLRARQPGWPALRPDGSLFKSTLNYGLKFAIPIMAGVLIFRVDLLIVSHYRGVAEAGVYAVAAQVASLLVMLPAVIATLLFPRVASYQDQRGELAVQVTRHASFVMILICVLAAAASFLLPVIYGARFADAAIQLLILLPGVYLIGIESVLVQHFTGTGLPGAIPVFWLATLALNLGLNFVLIPVYGARGAAAASTLSYGLIFILVAVYFCRKTKRRPAEIFLLRGNELRNLFRPRRWPTTLTNVSQ